jgi:hypothetical protein
MITYMTPYVAAVVKFIITDKPNEWGAATYL